MQTTNRRKRITAAFAGLVFGLAWVVYAPTASAGEGKPAASAAQGTHCVISVTTKAVDCFATITESIAFATGGRVTDAPSDVLTAVKDPDVTARINGGGPGALAVIGIQYYLANYGSHSLTVNGPDVGCDGPVDPPEYFVAPLPNFVPSGGINWNNNIRSFQGYSGCWQALFDDPGCTVRIYPTIPPWWGPFAADLGVANDRAECIYWS
ncbi:hypothetical protein [Saccharothrix lopnurensis]|uniref:Peptidase inhibitor family I36 n=1 Tax=Saccharothrix lopnurensis TaxID=1670621 RepID=A0ABW1PA29_9PSEU